MLPAQLTGWCWLIFLVFWAASAASVKRAAEKQPWSARLVHRVPVWIGLLLLFIAGRPHRAVVWIPYRAGMRVAAGMLPVEWAGFAVCALGLGFAIWARKTLARNWSGDVEFKQGHELVTCGPYALARHPIYTGILLMCLGTAIGQARPPAFLGVAFVLLGFWIKIRQEERLMLLHFPDQYPAYKARVKALVPFLL